MSLLIKCGLEIKFWLNAFNLFVGRYHIWKVLFVSKILVLYEVISICDTIRWAMPIAPRLYNYNLYPNYVYEYNIFKFF